MKTYKEIIADIEPPTTLDAAVAKAFNLPPEDVNYHNSYVTYTKLRATHPERYNAILESVRKYNIETYPTLCEAKFKATLRAEVMLPDDVFERLYDYLKCFRIAGDYQDWYIDEDDYAEEMRKLAIVFGIGE